MVNLGKRVLYRILGPLRREMQGDIDNRLKKELLNNYDDFLFLRKFNETNKILLPGQTEVSDSGYEELSSV